MKNSYTEVFAFVIKLVLGITFIVASYHKIEDPAGFAGIIYGYAVFPGAIINLLAIAIPFLELVAGFSLILGVYPRSALLIMNLLLSGFILIIGFNLLRGHQFDCGCFSFSGQSNTASNVSLLVRDVFLLGAGIYLWKKISAS
ncbi:MauE/DoxX family redox-associated membrane protein [Desulfobacula phenolica]|uniref:Methylamine utilisation protein MauE n=1 Tax=Desulfobacula phenolica TaxID=90732 RepID=A0A1H2EST7_9BACT|nr:MauE/DoxX family redox-associated membrane protein [Desulfobacula phenolica]SDT98134.1 Methylamine utilisation protein MauE [Desulfobacula phenolica]